MSCVNCCLMPQHHINSQVNTYIKSNRKLHKMTVTGCSPRTELDTQIKGNINQIVTAEITQHNPRNSSLLAVFS